MKQAILRKTLTGNWEEFSFPKKGRFFFVKNLTSADIFVSFEENDSEEESIKIKSGIGEEVSISFNGLDRKEYYTKTIYVKGSGEVEVQSLDIAIETQPPLPTEWRIHTREIFGGSPDREIPEYIANGQPLHFQIIPNWQNYEITWVSVYMGEDEISNQVWDESTMTIDIPAVTAETDIAITIVEVQPTTVNLTTNLTNCSTTNESPNPPILGQAFSCNIVPDDPTLEYGTQLVIMNGVDVTSEAWDYETGVVSIASVTGDITLEFDFTEPIEDVLIESIRYTDGQGNTCIGFGMNEGGTCDLWDNLEILPAEYTDGVVFSSSDDQVIEVDGGGVVTAVGSAGESATVTISSMEDPNVYTTVSISISDPDEPEEPEEQEE